MMKAWVTTFLMVLAIQAAFAADQAELDMRVRMLTEKFDSLQQKPEKCVPSDVLAKARGIVLLDRTKAGFIFAYQGGGGVALLKNGAAGGWSPVAFMSANEASIGAQIGGEQTFVAIVLMNTNSLRMLTDSKTEFGGEARGTAGGASSGVQGTISEAGPVFYVYTDRQGLYGGAAVKGGALTPNEEDDRNYYGQSLTTREILVDHKVQATESARALADKLAKYSRPAK